METKVIIRGVHDTAELRSFAESKLDGALERFQDRVLGATMRVEDETGDHKHGVDKVCSVEVRLRHGDVRIKEIGEEFHSTIDVTMDRVRAALSREVAKVKRGVGEG